MLWGPRSRRWTSTRRPPWVSSRRCRTVCARCPTCSGHAIAQTPIRTCAPRFRPRCSDTATSCTDATCGCRSTSERHPRWRPKCDALTGRTGRMMRRGASAAAGVPLAVHGGARCLGPLLFVCLSSVCWLSWPAARRPVIPTEPVARPDPVGRPAPAARPGPAPVEARVSGSGGEPNATGGTGNVTSRHRRQRDRRPRRPGVARPARRWDGHRRRGGRRDGPHHPRRRALHATGGGQAGRRAGRLREVDGGFRDQRRRRRLPAREAAELFGRRGQLDGVGGDRVRDAARGLRQRSNLVRQVLEVREPLAGQPTAS